MTKRRRVEYDMAWYWWAIILGLVMSWYTTRDMIQIALEEQGIVTAAGVLFGSAVIWVPLALVGMGVGRLVGGWIF